MSSAGSIVELSRSRSRYHDQDALLKGFVGMPGCTAKEVAVEALDWRYEQYANASKRAHDLSCLGYLEQLEGRACRHTGKVAHTYRATDKGLAHLRALGLPTDTVKKRPQDANSCASTQNAVDRIEALRRIVT